MMIQKDDFVLYQHPKTVEDASEVFPNVDRIPDAMIRMVEPTNPFLVTYLATINPTVETGVLLLKGIAGTSKHGNSSKKFTKDSPSKPDKVPTEKEITNPVQESIVLYIQKEVMPSKYGVLKQTKKMAHRPRHSHKKTIYYRRGS